MKLITILLLFTAAAVGALVFLGKQFNMDIIPLETPTLPDIRSVSDVQSQISGTTTVQKWQDSNGQWHFSNTAPEDVEHAESLLIHTGQNVVPHFKASSQAAPARPATQESALGVSPTLPSQILMQMQQEAAQQALQDKLH